MRPDDPELVRAIAAIDAGDVATLEALLATRPALGRERIATGWAK